MTPSSLGADVDVIALDQSWASRFRYVMEGYSQTIGRLINQSSQKQRAGVPDAIECRFLDISLATASARQDVRVFSAASNPVGDRPPFTTIMESQRRLGDPYMVP